MKKLEVVREIVEKERPLTFSEISLNKHRVFVIYTDGEYRFLVRTGSYKYQWVSPTTNEFNPSVFTTIQEAMVYAESNYIGKLVVVPAEDFKELLMKELL